MNLCGECDEEAISFFSSEGRIPRARCREHDTETAQFLRDTEAGVRWTWKRIVTYTIWDGKIL